MLEPSETETVAPPALPVMHCQIVNIRSLSKYWRLLRRTALSRNQKGPAPALKLEVDKDRLIWRTSNLKTAIQLKWLCINLEMRDELQELYVPLQVLELLSELNDGERLKIEAAQFWPHRPIEGQPTNAVHLCLKQADMEFHFRTIAVTDSTIPTPLPQAEHLCITLPNEVLREALRQTREMVARESEVPKNVNCLLVDQFPDHVKIVGTDGHSLAVYRYDFPISEQKRARILIPRELFDESGNSVLDDVLECSGDVTFTDLGGWLHIQAGPVCIWQHTGFNLMAVFVPYENVYKERVGTGESVILRLEELSKALERIVPVFKHGGLATMYLQATPQYTLLKTSEESVMVSQQSLAGLATGNLSVCLDARKLLTFCRQFQTEASVNGHHQTLIELHLPHSYKHAIRLKPIGTPSTTDYFLMRINGELDW